MYIVRILTPFLYFFSVCSHMHRPCHIYATAPFLFPSLSLYLIKYYTATRILCSPRATTVAQWSYILYGYNRNYKDTAATSKNILYNIQYRYVHAYDIVSIMFILLLLTYIGSGGGGVKNNGTVKRQVYTYLI